MVERESLPNEFSPYAVFMVYCAVCKDILYVALEDNPSTRKAAQDVMLGDRFYHARQMQTPKIHLIELPKPSLRQA